MLAMSARSGRTPQPPPSTGRTSLGSKQDKQERLKFFLINKLRERNAIDNPDARTLRILNEEADRMLCKPASEQELRNAEVRILKRLKTPEPRPSRQSRVTPAPSHRSAVSRASEVLDTYRESQGGSSSRRSSVMSGSTARSAAQTPTGANMDYWLKFTKMDVDNYREEEKKRQEEERRRRAANAKYLDQQVQLKRRTQEAAKLADRAWKKEATKDYNKWQEENIIVEARERKRRDQYVKDTDAMLHEKEKLIQKELDSDRQVDLRMLERIKAEMLAEKDKAEAKKHEERKVVELMKMQNQQIKAAKNATKAVQAKEEKKMQKEYAKILQKQAQMHADQQKKFHAKIKQCADRMDEYVRKEKEAQGLSAAADEAATQAQILKDKEDYRKQMIADAENAAKKKANEKTMFKAALSEQLNYKAEQERLAKEEQRAAMRNLKKELSIASAKEEERAGRVREANYRNKQALDAQIVEKHKNRERARWMSEEEKAMNRNLIRKVDQGHH
eukprot:TRINITY_DN10265_c0_g2_i1.p1 TRINITY_DN10265_c0_g2~~TRINITY_DN10265_c0_g2_i1.p1  ORF type:complete len:504 (-),score=179.16 TRINITY_DN10265_c0_g2_i1:112-1623(-)